MLNFLRPSTDALYDRMQREGRILESRVSSGDGTAPNFRSLMDRRAGAGLGRTITALYDPDSFTRAWKSLVWRRRRPAPLTVPNAQGLATHLARSI
jgi:hypothetical protein